MHQHTAHTVWELMLIYAVFINTLEFKDDAELSALQLGRAASLAFSMG